MSNAKKYFDIPKPMEEEISYEPSPEAPKVAGSSGLEEMIDKVNKKVNEPPPVKKETKDYDASLPEQIIPDYRDSLDEVVNGKDAPNGGGRKGRSNGPGTRSKPKPRAPSTPVITPPPGAGKFSYVVGELLQKARDNLVEDSDSPIYQLSRKIGANVLPDSEHWSDNVIREVTGLGLYLLINGLFEKRLYKK